ncbi:MAG: VOC family protein [Planctomycetota bacterium]
MKPTPPGWPRLSVAAFYDDPRAAIDWLCGAFGFAVRILVDGPDGAVMHSELEYGEAVIMVAGATPPQGRASDAWRARLASPSLAGARVTANFALYVDDVDAHCATARAHGAEVVSEPQDVDYGPEHWSDRNYCALDLEGHVWWFMQRLSTGGSPA